MKQERPQFDWGKFSCGKKCQTTQLFPDLGRPGMEKANRTIYGSEFTWGAKSREWRERNKTGSEGPFSLSCHWESQVCNKACWVLIRLCGFGQERKKEKIPVMTWHLLLDSHWGCTERAGPNQAQRPQRCPVPMGHPGSSISRRMKEAGRDRDHGKVNWLLLGTHGRRETERDPDGPGLSVSSSQSQKHKGN